MKNDGYRVGYGRPPHKNQFQKGRSGNPKGRPKNTLDIKGALKKALGFQVAVKQGGTSRGTTAAQAIVEVLLHKASAGEPQMLELLMDLYSRARPSWGAPTHLIVEYVRSSERHHEDVGAAREIK